VGTSASSSAEKVVQQSQGEILAAKGEYDFTALDIANNKPLSEIRGLVWWSDDKICINSERLPINSEKLNEFPFVSDIYRRHLHINNYQQADQFYPYIDLFTGRGCSWGKCIFCIYPNTINKGLGYRTRTIPNVIEELKFIKSEMPYIKEVFFQDDTLPSKRCVELSQAILDNHLKLTWSCFSRATADMNKDVLKLMKQSGCRTMHVGYESANQKLLKDMCKGINIETAEKFTKDACDAGLLIVGDFLVGLPGETHETIKRTVEWAIKLPVQRYTFSLPKPYPNTPFYDYLVKNNFLKDGHPNYPELSSDEIYRLNKWAYRKVYLNPRYLMRTIAKPSEWDRVIKSAFVALPYFFNREPQSHKDLEW
jgi:anaerobic magnesium-protoporphyrin IX monomethyl ester cyclase